MRSSAKLKKVVSRLQGILWAGALITVWPFSCQLDLPSDNTELLPDNTKAPPEVIWEKRFGENDDERLTKVRSLPDGSFFTMGNDDFVGSVYSDIWIMYHNSDGDMLWSAKFGDRAWDSGEHVVLLDDGGFLIAGSYEPGEEDNVSDGYIIRLSAEGDTIWEKWYNKNERNYFRGLVPVGNDEYLVSGMTRENNQYTIWLLRITGNGEQLWSKVLSPDEVSFYIQSICATDDGHLVIGGEISPDRAFALTIAFTLKVDTAGNVKWYHRYRPHYVVRSMTPVSGGGVILTGSSDEEGVWLAELDVEGQVKWERTYKVGEFYENDAGYYICAHPDNGYLICGKTAALNGGWYPDDAFVAHMAPSGTIIWTKIMSVEGEDQFYCIDVTPEGNIIAVGAKSMDNRIGSEQDAWMVLLGKE